MRIQKTDLFPKDFRFQLTKQDVEDMVLSQTIPSKSTFGGHLPYAFTEEGLYRSRGKLMTKCHKANFASATILTKSDMAKQVHFHIVKTFAKLRQISKNLQTIVKTDDKLKQKKLIKNSNELLNEVIEADIVEEKSLKSNVKKVKDEFEINLGVIKFKRTIENKD